MDSNIFYVYAHTRKTDGKCFYIGKGKGKRKDSIQSRNQYWKNIVNKHGFESIILVNNISEKKAFELESSFCKQIGYKNLCNLNEQKGRGYSKNQETKNKISVARKKYIQENGFPPKWYEHSKSRRKKASQTWKQIWKNDNGEIGNKISKSKKGKTPNRDYKKHAKKISKPIICHTLFGIEFPSIDEASKQLDCNAGGICLVLKGKKSSYKGFTFSYV